MDVDASNAGSALFSSCVEEHGDVIQAVMLCVTQGLEATQESKDFEYKNWLLLLCSFNIFYMQVRAVLNRLGMTLGRCITRLTSLSCTTLIQVGFAMLCAGSVRRKNISNTLLKNLLDACGAAIAWYCVGYAFAFGDTSELTGGKTFAGTSGFFMTGNVDYIDWFFEYSFSAACVTIIAGTLAERSRMASYIAYSMFMVAFVYPIIVHSMWSFNGFLSPTTENPLLGIGAIDFSGSGVVHLTGGATALIATCLLGPRKGRFYDNKGELLAKPKDIAGHSVSLQTLGALCLWFGWLSFNVSPAIRLETAVSPSAVASTVAVNTALAGSAAAISALATNMWLGYLFDQEVAIDLTKTINGTLTGLAAM